MGLINGMRALNALVGGGTTGPRLSTYLSTANNSGSFLQILQLRSQCAVLAGSSVAIAAIIASSSALAMVVASPAAMAELANNDAAMAAIAASSTAMATIAASSTAMAAIVASSKAISAIVGSATAMSAIAASAAAMAICAASAGFMVQAWASNTAADAILLSAVAKLAVYNADTALYTLQQNPTQIARQIGIGGRTTSASTSLSAFVFVANGTKVLLLRRYYSSTDYDCIDWARGSTVSGQGVVAGSGGRTLDTSVAALGCVSGSYTSNGIAPVLNDATANFVAAANGLQRRTYSSGATLNVIYLLV